MSCQYLLLLDAEFKRKGGSEKRAWILNDSEENKLQSMGNERSKEHGVARDNKRKTLLKSQKRMKVELSSSSHSNQHNQRNTWDGVPSRKLHQK